MAKQGLDIAPPSRKRVDDVVPKKVKNPEPRTVVQPSKTNQTTGRAVSFDNIGGEEKVQFNKRITRSTADGFEMLAIKTRKRVPNLLVEALELLEKKYGKS